MPNMIFASNNIAHWPLSLSSTLAGTFDATRVPYSLKLPYQSTMSSPVFTPSTGAVTWLHQRTWMDSLGFNDVFLYIKVFDAAGNTLFKVEKINQIDEFQAKLSLINETTSVNANMSFPFNQGTMNSVDFRYELGANLIKVDMYVNGALAVGLEFTDTNDSGFGQPSYFTLGSAFAGSADFQYFSEILVADGDTRNARLNLLRATAEGGETDWVGAAAALADDDPTSGMTTLSADQRETLQLGAYVGAANISQVMVVTQSLTGANAPQNLRHTVRMGAVNYDGPVDQPLGDTLQYNLTDFQINPATSLPWVSADLASLEMGFISKT